MPQGSREAGRKKLTTETKTETELAEEVRVLLLEPPRGEVTRTREAEDTVQGEFAQPLPRPHKSYTVAVGVFDIHLTRTPRLIDWFDRDSHTFCHELRVQNIDVSDEQVDAAGSNAISGERGQMQPDAIAGNTHVAGICFFVVDAMGELPPEAEQITVELSQPPHLICEGAVSQV